MMLKFLILQNGDEIDESNVCANQYIRGNYL